MPYNVMSKQSTERYNSSRTKTISPHTHTHTISCTPYTYTAHTHPPNPHTPTPLYTPMHGHINRHHTHTPTPTHIMLRKVLAFAEGAVKKVLASLEKCRHLLKELLKSVSKLTYDIYIYIREGG